MLGKIFGYGREKSYALASIVDSAGQVVVETADRERVTLDQGKIHGYGADPRIPTSKGSMSAIVECGGRSMTGARPAIAPGTVRTYPPSQAR